MSWEERAPFSHAGLSKSLSWEPSAIAMPSIVARIILYTFMKETSPWNFLMIDEKVPFNIIAVAMHYIELFSCGIISTQ